MESADTRQIKTCAVSCLICGNLTMGWFPQLFGVYVLHPKSGVYVLRQKSKSLCPLNSQTPVKLGDYGHEAGQDTHDPHHHNDKL